MSERHDDGPKEKNIFGFVTDDREDEPLEEADALNSDATAPACELPMGARDAPANESEVDIFEEIQETFKPEKMVLVESPVDGMPIEANLRTDLATAHPFTVEIGRASCRERV